MPSISNATRSIAAVLACTLVVASTSHTARAALHPIRRAMADSDSVAPNRSPLHWRNLGPAHLGTRVNDIDAPSHAGAGVAALNVIYKGGPDGLFKTVDGAATWKSLFDDQAPVAVNSIAVDPTNDNVVWVGTGDPMEVHAEVR